MSPSEITAQTQAQDEAVLEPVDGGDGEGNRSQVEAKDDAALLVCLYAGCPWSLCRIHTRICADSSRGRWDINRYVLSGIDKRTGIDRAGSASHVYAV